MSVSISCGVTLESKYSMNKQELIASILKHKNISHAAQALRISRQAIYAKASKDEDIKAAIEQIKSNNSERLQLVLPEHLKSFLADYSEQNNISMAQFIIEQIETSAEYNSYLEDFQ